MGAPFLATSQSRKYQVLAYITDYLIREGRSPSIDEIAAHFDFSDTRAKALVHKLAQEQLILRQPGAQRAISVPGLSRKMQIEQAKAVLRDHGFVVDEDFRPPPPPAFPKGHLPIVAVLEHTPDPESGEGGDDDDVSDGVRAAAGNAPGAWGAAASAPGAEEAEGHDEGRLEDRAATAARGGRPARARRRGAGRAARGMAGDRGHTADTAVRPGAE